MSILNLFQNYDSLATQLSSETAQIQGEINELEREVRKLETKWQDLKLEYDRSEMLLEKARQEGGNGSPKKKKDGKQMSLKETLTMQLKEQEELYSKMRAVS